MWTDFPSKFPTKYVFIASVHSNYVDCNRWLGDFILSKIIWQGILTTLSQSNGGYKYDYATVPFIPHSSPRRMTTEWKSVHLYPIPSIIYLIHNNVQFATLTYVDTSTYQIMRNLKIVTTGILFRLFLQRKLSYLQWMAIVLLAIGTTTSQVLMENFYDIPVNLLIYLRGVFGGTPISWVIRDKTGR